MKQRIFVVASACVAACSADPTSKPVVTGTVRADIEAPPGVECVRIEIDGRARSVVKDVPVSAGSGSSVEIGSLPLGPVVVTASGYGVSCSSVTAATKPAWATLKPVTAEIPAPPQIAEIPIVLYENGDAIVSVGFDDECLGVDPRVALGLLTEPTVVATSSFGNADSGSAAAVATSCPSGDIVVAGTAGSTSQGRQGLLLRYASGSNSPGTVAHGAAGSTFLAVAPAEPEGAAVFGGGFPPTCGAHDGVGDTEQKSLFAFLGMDGTQQTCAASTTFFPYSGYEYFEAGLQLADGNFLGAGIAETCGFGNNVPVIAKFDATGALLAKATEPGEDFANPACAGGSEVRAMARGSDPQAIYLAGSSALTGFGEDGVNRPALLRYDPDLTRTWKTRDSTRAGTFEAVSVQGGSIYASGKSGNGGFIEKYDANGNVVWSADVPGTAELGGVLALPTRIYAVGNVGSDSTEQAVLAVIDPGTGQELSVLTFGSQPANATALTLDGADLVAVGSVGPSATSDLLFARFALQPADGGE